MARGRKLTSESLEEKIALQQEAVDKARARYEAECAELAELVKKRDETRKLELMAALEKSSRSFPEILAFIQGVSLEELEEPEDLAAENTA